MTDYEATGSYYTINHLSVATGLTDRTLRSYIAMGILEGEKINGIWHFSEEQTDSFLRHPKVRPSILAKKNAIVYDFLSATRHDRQEACIILDLPKENLKQTAEFFCYSINNGSFTNLRFSFDGIGDTARVILKGSLEDVMQLLREYRRR